VVAGTGTARLGWTAVVGTTVSDRGDGTTGDGLAEVSVDGD
jgi:hypothetical protein